MSIKRASSEVSYAVDVFADNAVTVYPRSAPKPVAVTPLQPDLIYERPSSIYKIEINANEDFDLPLQLTRIEHDGTETPIDLGATPVLEFYIRPRFDHSTVIKKLTVGTGSGIIIDDGALGMITLHVEQAVVASDLLVSKSPAEHWDYFFNWKVGIAVTELFRGPFVVHAGRYP